MNNNRTKPEGINRRNFLKLGTLSGLALGSGSLLNGCGRTGGESRTGKAKNIIFMVSDGMSMGTLTAADHLMRRKLGRTSNWISLYEQNRVRRGLMDMASATSIVTDSAAAASSWGCGQRVYNGSINTTDDGEALSPVLKLFRDAGKGTGLVTTTRLTHATPAGFSANVPRRQLEDDIATQYLDRGYDLFLGGGSRHFEADRRNDGRNLFSEFKQAGYHVARNKQELNRYDGNGKLLGVFFDTHMPYTLDHRNTDELSRDLPTLPEMTRVALNRLSKDSDGFLLQVEGGRVDHGAHANDAAGMIYDQIMFDDAIGAVLEFAENRDDTLVIITTDHGNANPGLNAAGSGYLESNWRFDKLGEFRHTNNWIIPQLDERSSVSQIREIVEYATRIEIRRDEAEVLISALTGKYENLYRVMSTPYLVLGQILANYLAFNWIGRSHTADYVELCGFGPGSEKINAFNINTDIFPLMLEAAEIRQYA